MSRPLRIEFPGAVYHVTSRGDGREDIYLSDEDREIFFKVLSHVVDRFGWKCHAWCLMTNHYHLMIETPKGNLSKGMRQLNGVYTQRFNRSHSRVGHVFQGRYKAILIEKEAYLLELCRYIVRNPVAAGMVALVADWPWSSYRATAGLEKVPAFGCINWILEQFGGSAARYREYVDRTLKEEGSLKKAKGSHVLGSEAFRENVQKNIKADSEIPRLQKHIVRLSLNEIKAGVLDRGAWMAHAYRHHGYTMREIAEYARVHYSLVSKVIKAWEESNSTFKT
jgi:REP element-mobilizing transposase RayT